MALSTEDIDPRSYDVAADFCKMVGADNLMAYLAQPEGTPPKAMQEALRARRKRMQGMQSNPKYKDEALFLIKHFSDLVSVLGQPQFYHSDLRRRRARAHLPALELAIRGALTQAVLSREDEDRLYKGAAEMGIDYAWFQDTLDRLCNERGVQRATRRIDEPVRAPATVNHYGLLGVASTASLEDIRAAYKLCLERAERHPDPRLRAAMTQQLAAAWEVLRDPARRAALDASPVVRPTASVVPTRRTTVTPPAARAKSPATTTVVDGMLVSGEGLPARIELVGEAERKLRWGKDPVDFSLSIRNAGDQAMPGRIRSTAPWLQVEPNELDPLSKLQPVRVQVTTSPGAGQHIGKIVFDAGTAGTVEIVVQLTHGAVLSPTVARASRWVGAGALAVLVGISLAGGSVLLTRAQPPPPPPPPPVVAEPWTIEVAPAAVEIRVDGVFAGRGRSLRLPDLDGHEVDLEVIHPNFAPWRQKLTARAGLTTRVELVPARPLDFVPDPSLVRANVPARESDPVLAWVRSDLEACARQRAAPGALVTGTVLVHVDRDGVARGLDVSGSQADDADLRACIEPWARILFVPPLLQGDYATLRYDYAVTGKAAGP